MNVSPYAIVSPKARLASDVEVGPFSVVHDDVEIGAGSQIGAYCEIGIPWSARVEGSTALKLGKRTLIRSNSVIYAGSVYGDGLELGHRVTLREGVHCGVGVRIGTQSDIQGDCEIGDFVRMHSSVFVAKGSLIRRCAWLLPRVVLTNDPTPPSDVHYGCVIGEFAVVAAAAVIMPGVNVGTHAVVGAAACVVADVPPGMLVLGVPARVVGPASSIRMRSAPDTPAYPWTRHFHRGYPPELVRNCFESASVSPENSDAS